MAERVYWIIALVVISNLIVNGCDSIQSSPKVLVVDGQTYFACSGMVWVDTEGGGLLGGTSTFKVSYTDAAGLSHVLRGIKTVEQSDMPKLVDAPMPTNPSMTDKDGKPLIEGMKYTWEDGSQGQIRNGKLAPVQIPNPACKPPAK